MKKIAMIIKWATRKIIKNWRWEAYGKYTDRTTSVWRVHMPTQFIYNSNSWISNIKYSKHAVEAKKLK